MSETCCMLVRLGLLLAAVAVNAGVSCGVFAQDDRSGQNGLVDDLGIGFGPKDIPTAIADLSSSRFIIRQRAFEFLVECDGAAVHALETGVESSASLEERRRCLEALAQIATGDRNSNAAIEALRRLSESEKEGVARLAAGIHRVVTTSDRDRAIAALKAMGVRLRLDRRGEISSILINQDKQVRLLRHFPALTYVSLTGPQVTDSGIRALSKLPQIESVSIMRSPVTSVGLESLSKLSSLNRLSLYGVKLGSWEAKRLAKIPNLRSLSIEETTDEFALQYLPDIKQVQYLSLTNPQATRNFASAINRCENLRTLSLSMRQAEDSDLEELPKIAINFNLSLTFSEELTRHAWENLGKSNLSGLSLFKVSIRDADLRCLTSLHDLSRLSINECEITDDGIRCLEALKQLRYVTLRGTNVTKEGADWLRGALPNVRRVTLYEGNALPGIAVKPAPGPPSIEYKENPDGEGTDAYLKGTPTLELLDQLKGRSDLHTVFLMRDDRVDEQLSLLKVIPMKGIHVSSDKLTGAGFRALAGHDNLESIFVRSKTLDDQCVSPLLQLPRLQRLQLIGTSLTADGIDALIEGMKANVSITSLNLSNCPGMTDASLAGLGNLGTLKELILSGNEQITGNVLNQAGKINGLESLKIHGCVFSPGQLESIRDLALTRLSLSDSKLPGRSIEQIASFYPGLQVLELKGTNIASSDLNSLSEMTELKSLNLAETEVDDDGLEAIGKLAALEWLSLSHTNVSDGGLQKLEPLNNLKHLYIDSTQITVNAMTQFQTTHPNTAVRR